MTVARAILGLALLAWLAGVATPERATAQPVKVLFIGNSYTYVNDLPMMVRLVAQAAGESRLIEPRTIGAPGATLQKHWEKGEARGGNPQMQQPLNQAYLSLARELGALVAPVGPAWQRALQESRGLPFYQPDQSHPSPAGSYAAACVFYSLLYGKPAGALPNGVFGMSSGDVDVIRKAAWEAVQEVK